jgi:hypothetical protein
MRRRFAIVIGVAAAGVMALGAQTATSSTVEPGDSTPPDLRLSGPKKQELGNAVKVKASCGDEACTVRGSGELTKVKEHATIDESKFGPAGLVPASADLGPGETTTLKLKLDDGDESASQRKTRKKARKALDEGKKVEAKVTVHATDAAGNEATAKRTIKLVK